MARSRGRSSGGFSRSAPKPSKSPAPAPSPARASTPQQSGPTTGGLGSVVAEGMGFGVGNAVAHRAVDGMMGPRVIRHETVASAAAANVGNLDSCVGQFKAFEDAIQTGWLHPNINLENPDVGVDKEVLVGAKKEQCNIKVALSNSFGFGGHNSSILFAPYKDQ